MNYYEHWLGDYRKKTGRLRILEHGVYRLLLDECYAIEQPLPASIDELCVICGAMDKADRAAVRKVADAYFPIGPDGLRHNARAEEEMERAQPRIAAAKLNGAKGGRRKRTQRQPSGNPVGSQQEPSGNPAETQAGEAFPHTPYPTDQKQVLARKRATPARQKTGLPDGFAISDRVAAWAADKGHTRLAERLEDFVGKVRRNGYRYVDWDEAFMGAIREDWAGFNGSDEAKARRLRGEKNIDILTGKEPPSGRRTEQVVVAERVDRAPVLALPGGLRQPRADDVEGCRPDGSARAVGG